jgi:hypothetical protein
MHQYAFVSWQLTKTPRRLCLVMVTKMKRMGVQEIYMQMDLYSIVTNIRN